MPIICSVYIMYQLLDTRVPLRDSKLNNYATIIEAMQSYDESNTGWTSPQSFLILWKHDIIYFGKQLYKVDSHMIHGLCHHQQDWYTGELGPIFEH